MLTEGTLNLLTKRLGFGAVSLAQGATITDASGMVSQISGPTSGSMGGSMSPTQMGPGVPPMPYPLGSDPRLTQYRVGWNLPSLPGEGRVSFDTLREVAKTEWLTRKAIEVRKNQIHNIKLDIVAKDRKDRKRAKELMVSNESAVMAAKKFFVKPDGRHYFHDWMSALLEDHLVYDAVAMEKVRNMDPNAGPKHPYEDFHLGQLVGLELVDGRTIKPLIDDGGRMPLPPLPAYQQYVYGVPRASFSEQEFIYAPKNVRNETPYGFSAVEQFLWLTFIVLRYWSFVGAKYTDGTLPEGVAEAPANWTTAQIAELNLYWDDLLAGDPKALKKLQFVPGGFKFHQFKDPNFDWRFAQLMIEMTSVAFDVTTSEMGFASFGGKNVQIGGGQSAGESAEDLAQRRGPLPLMSWLINRILNPVLWEEFGAEELEWVMTDANQASEKDHADALKSSIYDGLISIDQAVEENGGAPLGLGRFWSVGNMLLSETDMKTIQKDGWAGLQKQVANAMPKPAAGVGGNPNGQPTNLEEGKLGAGMPHSLSGSGSASNPNIEPEQATNAARRTVEHGGGFSSTSEKDDKGDTHHTIFSKKDAELDVFKRKAIKSLKNGKSANVRFESEVLTSIEVKAIQADLVKAVTVDDVREVFERKAIEPDLRRMSALIDELTAPSMARLDKIAETMSTISLFKSAMPAPAPVSVDARSRTIIQRGAFVAEPAQVTVEAAQIHVPEAKVEVKNAITVPEAKVEVKNEINVPEQKLPVVINQIPQAAAPNITVVAPEVRTKRIAIERDDKGVITEGIVTEE